MSEKTTSAKAVNHKKSRKKNALQSPDARHPNVKPSGSEAVYVGEAKQGLCAQETSKAQMRGPKAPPRDKPKKVYVTNKPADTR